MEKQCCKKTQLPSYTSPNNNNETQQALPKTGNLRPSRPVTTTTNDNNATAEVAECCSGRTTCTGYGKVLNSRKAGLLVESGAGQNATISFDYTAGFDAKVATAKAWWTMPSLDLPFIGMDNDACKYTGCPIVAGRKQAYSYELPIMKIFPSRAYDVKWQLLNENGEQCCFIIPIVIKNKRGRI
ncbi:conserved hypothetical protein [Culex quinquefasciatus]|uniref:MD-2-related lipid-recognition domain-containing protein n=1 Tax=Culex quinquefasciatus TaxID=7176 RepID=B0WEP0_CULQU|nr:conserved hypothetical protein [Culex quinquefasciatus]|eukprot:XP_001847174.1 conserved hypothetical protein [Culex quinquefasciatus]